MRGRGGGLDGRRRNVVIDILTRGMKLRNSLLMIVNVICYSTFVGS